MPTVPGLLPSVAPSEAGTPSVRVSADAAAFGGVVGQGLAHLGEGIGHASNEIWNRAVALQQLRNESEAKEADALYMMQSGKLHAEFSSLQGKAAVAAFPKYQQDLQEKRLEIRRSLSTEQSQKMYDSSALAFMGRNIFNGAGHAAQQNKVYAAGASQSRLDQIKDYTLHNPDDEDAYERAKIQIRNEVHTTQAPIKGWGSEQIDEAIKKDISSLTALRIQGTARIAPFQAKEMLETYRDSLRFDDLERAEKLVQSQMRTTGARMLSDAENTPPKGGWKDGKEPPLQDRIDRAVAKADQIAPDDKMFSDFVRDRVIADFNRGKAVKRDFELANRNTVEGALMGGVGGKIPTTVEELRTLDPKVDKAWTDLDEIHQRSYMKALAANAKGDTAWGPESLKRYQALKGMSNADPAEFMGVDVVSEKMPNRARLELINLQQKLKNQVEGDPRITRALQQLRPMLGAAKISVSEDKEKYYQFTGGLQDALDQFQHEHKKQPSSKELQEIGARLLQEQIDPEKWSFGILTRKTPLIQMQPSNEFIEAAKADPRWAGSGIEPTTEMIQREYTRRRYQELYGGKATKSEAPGVPTSK